MTLEDLNVLDRAAFGQALGWIVEGSPWVAERAWERRPFSTREDLHAAMADVIASATASEQLRILQAHPDLGARTRLSAASDGEQSAAGLTQMAPADLDRMAALNRAYREKFEFPFLYAVKGSSPQDVLNALERRLTEPRDSERAEAMRQVYRIVSFRLEEMLK